LFGVLWERFRGGLFVSKVYVESVLKTGSRKCERKKKVAKSSRVHRSNKGKTGRYTNHKYSQQQQQNQ
jgi:hypothetical protein